MQINTRQIGEGRKSETALPQAGESQKLQQDSPSGEFD
jgi:hypothetical protein